MAVSLDSFQVSILDRASTLPFGECRRQSIPMAEDGTQPKMRLDGILKLM